MTRKIFGIGLNKTGTTSLETCFTHLGYKHLSCRRDLLEAYRAGRMDEIFAVTDQYDTFEDWPWPLMYQELFERYDDALFILTVRRSPEAWLKSIKSHSLQRTPVRGHCRKLAYGYRYPQSAEQHHLDFYNTHNAAVVAFFEKHGAADRLKVLCWEHGDGWDELCDFLDVPPVDKAFPHDRRAASGRIGKRQIANRVVMAAEWGLTRLRPHRARYAK